MIRVWQLGSLDHKIYPTKEALERLEKTIKDIHEKGLTDIIWGPELKVTLIPENNEEMKSVEVVFPQGKLSELINTIQVEAKEIAKKQVYDIVFGLGIDKEPFNQEGKE